MFISSILSFIGGNVFRMIFGEISAYFNKKLEHIQEMERMKLAGEEAAAQHIRNQEALRTQFEQGIKVVQVNAQAAIDTIDADGRNEVVKSTTRTIGVAWIDAWNAVIRPGVATWAIFMLTLEALSTYVFAHAYVMSDETAAIVGASLGIYLASRDLMKRGK